MIQREPLLFLRQGDRCWLPLSAARREALVPPLHLPGAFPTGLGCSSKAKHYSPWPLDAAQAALQFALQHYGFLTLKIISLVFLRVCDLGRLNLYPKIFLFYS